jgi:aldose 1-epimerase
VQANPFGTANGKSVFSYVLTNNNGVEAKLTNYGATLISLKVPDRNGKFDDVVLGYDDLQGYLNTKAFIGASIGRYGNRIAGAKFVLNGKTCTLAKNDGDNSLHGGVKGFDKVVWDAADASSAAGQAVQFTYVSKDGEEGYPGNLTIKVTYTLTPANEVKIDYVVSTDADTVQNLTNHSYFNLAAKGDILSHELKLEADRFTPINGGLIPTGELRSVAGTPFDFRTSTVVGARIGQDEEQLKLGGGYDHNWVLNGELGKLHPAAEVFESTTGRVMKVSTTEPGIQFYSGNFLGGEPGKGGKPNAYRTGLCLETQHFPDSPNQASFPTTTLKAGQTYKTTTIYAFSTR